MPICVQWHSGLRLAIVVVRVLGNLWVTVLWISVNLDSFAYWGASPHGGLGDWQATCATSRPLCILSDSSQPWGFILVGNLVLLKLFLRGPSNCNLFLDCERMILTSRPCFSYLQQAQDFSRNLKLNAVSCNCAPGHGRYDLALIL
jgi:hypothetical protein